jgi:hypothetical protein
MAPLFNILIRWLRGERLERATPQDYRLWFGVLAVLPFATAALMKFGRKLFDASPVILWVGITAFGVLTFALLFVWARFVPAAVSIAVACVAWTAFFYFLPFA